MDNDLVPCPWILMVYFSQVAKIAFSEPYISRISYDYMTDVFLEKQESQVLYNTWDHIIVETYLPFAILFMTFRFAYNQPRAFPF